MYVPVLVVLIATAAVAASTKVARVSDKSHPFHAASKNIEARSKILRQRARSSRNSRSSRGGKSTHTSMRHVARAQSSVGFLSIVSYNSSCADEQGFYTQASFGYGICAQGSSSSSSAESAMFTYSSGVLTENFYSDSSCTTFLSSEEMFDLSGFPSNTCVDSGPYSVEWSVSSSFSFPMVPGLYFAEYASMSACNAETQPLFFTWFGGESTDDDFPDDFDDDFSYGYFDDDFFDLTCVSSSFDDDFYYGNSTYDDDTQFSFTGTYLTVGFTTASNDDNSGSSSSSCFAGTETVQLAAGESVPLSQVKVGDRLLGSDAMGAMKYSEVIAAPHPLNNDAAVFSYLTTESGKDIKLAPEHLIMTSPRCDSNKELFEASEVVAGMCVLTTTGLEIVSSVSKTSTRDGIYTVILQDSEFLVVNGIVASPFAGNHAVGNAYYNLVRALPVAVMNFPFIKEANLVFASIVASFTA